MNNTDNHSASRDARTDAALYLLTVLLQRLDDDQPGLIAGLQSGVRADQAALPVELENRTHIEAVFAETIKLLDRAAQQIN